MTRRQSNRSAPRPDLSPHAPVPLSEAERRALFSVCDIAVYRAGRTSVVLALRGSRSQKVRRLGLEEAEGYGYFAGEAEEAVQARLDTLFIEGWLQFDFAEGLPLLAYTLRGLEQAKRYVAEAWLVGLREQVEVAGRGEAPALPFLMTAMPQRNHDTVLLLVDLLEQEADNQWLPLLRAWCAAETKRLRARLSLLVERLELRSRPTA